MINYRFPSPDAFAAVSTRDRADIGHHIHIALEENRGSIALEADKAFRLDFKPSSKAPRWSELGIALLDKGWLECRSIHVKYRASARQPFRVQAALRLHSDAGFHDHLARSPNEVDTTPQYFGADFALSPRLLEQVHACDLHLFFDNKANTMNLHDLVVTGFR